MAVELGSVHNTFIYATLQLMDNRTKSRMALSRVHTSTNAMHVVKLLLLNKCQVTYYSLCSMAVLPPNHNLNHNHNVIQTVTKI